MKVDLDSAQGGVLPEGEHVFSIADASDAVSKKGNEMLVLDLVVVPDPWKGAEVRDWIVPQFFPDRFVDLIVSVGLDIPAAGSDFDVETLIGLHVRGVVYHDDWEGKKRPKISAYRQLVEGDPPSPVGASAPAGTAPTDLPFLWQPVERCGQESNYNPFA